MLGDHWATTPSRSVKVVLSLAISDSNATQVALFNTSALAAVISDPVKSACMITGPYLSQDLLTRYSIGANDKTVC